MDQTEKGEGQITLQKLGRPGAEKSRRIDIPKKDVDPYNKEERNNSIWRNPNIGI
jgi:hypothetical protein